MCSLGRRLQRRHGGSLQITNAGQTWKAINGSGANALSLSNAGRIVLAITPSSPSTLYASIANANNGSLLGLFKTTDAGVEAANITVNAGATMLNRYPERNSRSIFKTNEIR